MRDLFFHPAFQSVVFPAVLSALGLAVLRIALPMAQQRWTAMAAVLALGAAFALLPGWDWPAGSAVQKLPWILAAGAVLAMVLEAVHAGPWTHWAGAALGWALASQWLAGAWAVMPAAMAAPLAGAGVLACVTALLPRPAAGASPGFAVRGMAAPALLTVASLGLAGWAAFGGSLLLAQLAAMVATVSGLLAVFGGWAGRAAGRAAGDSPSRPGAAVAGSIALMPLGLAWLALAQVASVSIMGTTAPAGADDAYYEPRWK